jgi:hypothetical protein
LTAAEYKADSVRHIFRRYAALGSVRLLQQELTTCEAAPNLEPRRILRYVLDHSRKYHRSGGVTSGADRHPIMQANLQAISAG